MIRFRRIALPAGLLCAMAVMLSSCGGASSSTVLAHVGPTPITRSELSHWMQTLAGGDYHQLSHGHPLPAGVVSEPPDDQKCVTTLESLAQPSAKATSSQLARKCRELQPALRDQAMTYLVNAYWTRSVYRDAGITVSEPEVQAFFAQVKKREFPTPAAQATYLSSRGLSLADEMFILKLDLLDQKATQQIESGGAQQALAKLTRIGQSWTTKTTCSKGYVVRHCKQYTEQQAPKGTSPAILMEQIATVAGVRCVNQAACSEKQ
jgi:hypothetical protein